MIGLLSMAFAAEPACPLDDARTVEIQMGKIWVDGTRYLRPEFEEALDACGPEYSEAREAFKKWDANVTFGVYSCVFSPLLWPLGFAAPVFWAAARITREEVELEIEEAARTEGGGS